MATVTKPDKYWKTLFEQATKEISSFQQAVFEWQDSPEANSKDAMLIRILANRERGRLAMDMINRPELPDAYQPEISRLIHTWTEAENKLFNRFETDKDYSHKILDDDFGNQIIQKYGELSRFVAQDSNADISILNSQKSQDIEHCPEPGTLISYALKELGNDQAAQIKEHIDSCLICQDLVFDTVMAGYEALQKQGESSAISDRLLSAIYPDPANELYKRLLNLVKNVNAHIKNRARDQSFQQKGFVFATATADEQPFKGIVDIPYEINITPRDGLLEIPCNGDTGEGNTFIEDILKREYFYTHVFAWDMAKNRTDWGIKRHEQHARAVSVVGCTDLLVVVGQGKAAVEIAAQNIPLWLENKDLKIERELNADVVLLWYRIIAEA